MGTAAKPQPVKLIVGLIAASENIFSKTEEALQRAFGPIDYRSQTIKFNFTDYYQKEMGSDLKRRFISFKRPINPAALFGIKLITNRLEGQLSKNIDPVRNVDSEGNNRISNGVKGVRRAVNIDPGYVTGAKLVLASTKDHNHRIYLDKGIYAEIALYYKNGSFRYWDWTYPDYKTDDYIKIFNQIRKIYMG